MEERILYELKSVYRDPMRIRGYIFGAGEKSACIVGAARGNEVQQMYICSQLVKIFTQLEQQGKIRNGKSVMIIPTINSYSMNIGKRFWSTDNTDINRMFPGYHLGETTQRIAAGVFENINTYRFGIQFTSFYMEGSFIPHVRMMKTGFEDIELAKSFGLPYVYRREPRPYDTTTLNYNWQIRGTQAFSLYTSNTENVDEAQARQAVSAVLRFLTRMGILRYNCHNGYIASILEESELVPVKSSSAGFFRKLVHVNDEVKRGDRLAQIIDPYLGTTISEIYAPVDGILFYSERKPIILQNSIAFQIIKKLHE